MAKDSTNNYYCIEADERVEYQLGESVKLRDDDTARRLGWLMVPLSRRDVRGACGNAVLAMICWT